MATNVNEGIICTCTVIKFKCLLALVDVDALDSTPDNLIDGINVNGICCCHDGDDDETLNSQWLYQDIIALLRLCYAAAGYRDDGTQKPKQQPNCERPED
jgi:hypothetical protein